MSKRDEPRPRLSQDELDDLTAEVTALLNDGGAHTKEFWKAYIKRHRKGVVRDARTFWESVGPREFWTSQYWRERAEEARENADQLRDEEAKSASLKTAATYDALANRIAIGEHQRRATSDCQTSGSS